MNSSSNLTVAHLKLAWKQGKYVQLSFYSSSFSPHACPDEAFLKIIMSVCSPHCDK